MAGHIKLDRKILTWEWYQDANTCRLFIHLLLIANHKDGKWQGHVIGRGQLITGLLKLNEDTGLTIRQLRTSFDKLKMTGEITIKTTNKFRLVTICKYDTYQSIKNENDKQNDNLIDSQATSHRQATDKPPTTNNNEKNNKEEKEENTIGEKHFEIMLVQDMKKIWKRHYPSYMDDDSLDFPACLQIAYKIAQLHGWGQHEVLNGKMPDTLDKWDKIAEWVRKDKFYKKLSLEMISKKFQGVAQSMDAEKDETPIVPKPKRQLSAYEQEMEDKRKAYKPIE